MVIILPIRLQSRSDSSCVCLLQAESGALFLQMFLEAARK